MDPGAGTSLSSTAARGAAVSILLVVLVCLLGAGSASAVVVQLPNGRVVGITPRAGVVPASIPGVRRSATPNVVDNGNLDYHGGPVLHSSAPYLIFWGAPGSIPTSVSNLLSQYFVDVAHDSGQTTNVYSVSRQYSDATGVADYAQTFSPAQVISDTHTFPPRDVANCVNSAPADETNCITDAQLQSELTRLIAADGLPTDGLTSASELVANAPIYFIVTPATVNVCLQAAKCSDNTFCAYHGNYTDGANNVLYSPIPLIGALVTDIAQGLNPKNCQLDGSFPTVQEPNGNGGDVALKYMNHEDSETITDPIVGAGWYDSISGNEIGDNCNGWQGGTTNVAAGSDPNAFQPTLGGSASAGTLFDQLINANKYYTQSEWSNGNVDCRMQPSGATLTPSFTVPSGNQAAGSPVSFDATASSSSAGYSSIGWRFGDGATRFVSTATTSNPVPTTVSHTYPGSGTFTVTLTVVDRYGNLASATHAVSVGASASPTPPSATFTATPSNPPVGTAASFSAAGSSDPNAGASLSSYGWSFGDGSTGTGPTPSHAYAAAGVRTVTLTVTDSLGLSSSATKQIQVVSPPTAAFTVSPASPVSGSRVTFDGETSSDPNGGGLISSYSWSFGDGGIGSGALASHAFASPGSYTVRLAVTDDFGLITTTSRLVAVSAPSKLTVSPASLTGTAKGKPKLALGLIAGGYGSSIRKIVISLPPGLSFSKKGLTKGLRVRLPGGQKLTFTAKLSHGELTVTLRLPARAVGLTIGRPALAVTRKLEHTVRRGRVRNLVVAVSVIPGAGSQTTLTVRLGVRR